jgi:hypothetical protein
MPDDRKSPEAVGFVPVNQQSLAGVKECSEMFAGFAPIEL